MAAKLRLNGCSDIENLLELLIVSKQKIQLDKCGEDSTTKVLKDSPKIEKEIKANNTTKDPDYNYFRNGNSCGVTPTWISMLFELHPSLTFSTGVRVEGLRTIAVYIASICQNIEEYGSLLGDSPFERAEIDQWLEYRHTEVEQAIYDRSLAKTVLQEFNCYLSDKIYLVGNKLSLADILLYCALHSVIKDMMPQEKELYTNISRWFYQVQSILAARLGLSLVTFQRNQLYSE